MDQILGLDYCLKITSQYHYRQQHVWENIKHVFDPIQPFCQVEDYGNTKLLLMKS